MPSLRAGFDYYDHCGVRSTILSHQIDVSESRQTGGTGRIGAYSAVGSHVLVTPGATTADRWWSLWVRRWSADFPMWDALWKGACKAAQEHRGLCISREREGEGEGEGEGEKGFVECSRGWRSDPIVVRHRWGMLRGGGSHRARSRRGCSEYLCAGARRRRIPALTQLVPACA
jgi:hypothetical protein